jgi:hypothetical protein
MQARSRPAIGLRARFDATVDSIRHRQLLDQIETCCLFLGYPRSGGTMLGALLNAHRHAIIAHELNLVEFIRRGYGERQLYARVLQRDQWFADRGWEWAGYDYTIPDQWQGRVERLRVIGDKRGASAARLLGRDPALLGRLRRVIRRPVRFIHAVRNPFDNISTLYRRKVKRSEKREATPPTLDKVIKRYFMTSRHIRHLIPQIGSENVFLLRHEDLVRDPRETLGGVCHFLGLDAPSEYLDSCAKVLYEQPNRSRQQVEWSPEQISQVEQRFREFEFLSGYAFEE